MDTHGGEGIDPAVVPAGEAAGDFATQTGNADAADWQEEVYQQIKSMKEKYLSDIHDEYQNIASKVQQHDSLSPNENIEKLKMFKTKLEHIMVFLGLNKHDILVTHKEKLLWVEKPISFFLSSYRPRKSSFSLLQGQLPQSSIQLQQLQSLDGQTNLLMQLVHGSMAAMQQNNLTNPQHISLSGISTIYNSQQDRIISPATGFSQQNPVNSPQEVNISSLSSQSGMHPVQPNLGSLWQNSSILQQQMYQQQQAFHSQQLMKHQQLFHRHQLIQQLLRQLQYISHIFFKLFLLQEKIWKFYSLENIILKFYHFQSKFRSCTTSGVKFKAPLDSSAQMGNANGADWLKEVSQKIKSLKEMYLPELNYIYLKIASEVRQARGGGEGAGAAAGDWRTGLVPYTRQRIVNKILEDIQRVFPVFRHRHVQELREIAVMFEEKTYNVATSWNDYLYRISFKLRTMTNCFHINTASSGQNAHGPGEQ
ncbi:hypothetical protein R3W88_010961 [Solanum pinnatisectum]|uniref:Mediator complex subunit 15 KIX domain-containing protein n=1 Tax=Solanum pinnatisectum TaxID=50273 RepID=A0AAV9L5E8_9SOLN|nr:hypothetical protein R3W88_010961 [Solanum pinnatisectum]